MFSQQDIQRFRSHTAGVNKVIHLNNAGSSLPPDSVREAVIDYLEEEMTHGGYETHAKYLKEIECVYDSIARLINADRSEIAVLENATAAWHAAFHAIRFEDGDEILTCQTEYSSNYLSYLHLQKRINVMIRLVPNDASGQVDVNALDEMVNERTKLISMVHVPTNSGLVNPVEAMGAVARKYNVLYLVDACQSAGQVPLDVEKIGCDMLSATGRKYLRAPRGTGFLYVRKSRLAELNPAVIDLHSAQWTAANEYELRNDARRFENWESNYAGILGLKKAVDYILGIGMDGIWGRIQLLADSLRERLTELPGMTVHDIGAVQGGIVSFSVAGHSAAEVKSHLSEHDINVSWVGVPNARLDMVARGVKEAVRASVHYFNAEEELDQLVEKLVLLQQ